MSDVTHGSCPSINPEMRHRQFGNIQGGDLNNEGSFSIGPGLNNDLKCPECGSSLGIDLEGISPFSQNDCDHKWEYGFYDGEMHDSEAPEGSEPARKCTECDKIEVADSWRSIL